MKNKKLMFFVIIGLFIALLLSGCTGRSFAATSWPGLSSDGSSLFIAHGSHIYALQGESGIESWRFPIEPDRAQTFFAAPAITDDGELIVGSYGNTLYSINKDNGAEIWQFNDAKSKYIGSALVKDNMVFAPNGDGNLYALDLQGNSLWTPFKTTQPQWARPAQNGQMIYTSALNHQLFALNIKTGQELWSADLGSASVGRIATTENAVFAGTFGNKMISLNGATGNARWEFDTQDWIWGGASLDTDNIYFGDLSGNLYAVNQSTGREVWPSILLDSPIFGSPLISDTTLYIGTEGGTAYAISTESGKQLWARSTTISIYSSPEAINGFIVFAGTEEDALKVQAFDTEGTVQWTYTPTN